MYLYELKIVKHNRIIPIHLHIKEIVHTPNVSTLITSETFDKSFDFEKSKFNNVRFPQSGLVSEEHLKIVKINKL